MNNTYTPDELNQAYKHHDVVKGVAFLWWLVNINGAGFALLREPHHSDEEIQAAKDELHRNRDVVGKIKVLSPAQTEVKHKSVVVVGRITGDDEDSAYAFENVTEDEASTRFEEKIWEDDPAWMPDPSDDTDDRTVLINFVMKSSTPIEIDYYA